MILPLFVPIDEIKNVINKTFHSTVITEDHLEQLFLKNNNLIINSSTKRAVYNFISEYKDSIETLKSYTKELERLILWCHIVAKIEILNVTREHIVKYQQFLENPTPKELWCGNKVPKLLKNGGINKEWKPFYHHLAKPSIKKTLKIIDSFFNYLVQINCLQGNPLAITRRRNINNSSPKIVDRYLEIDEINWALEALVKNFNQHEENTKTKEHQQKFLTIRAKYIILLLFYTGIRISEAANHTMGNFIQRESNWFLAIIGKGKKYREIPIPDELLDALSDFRRTIGLSYLPEFKEDTPLIPNVDLKSHLTSRRIDQILKWAFKLGADYISIEHPRKASKLNLASAHWLRHSYVTYLLNSGAPLKVAQENAGHSDIGTTMLYRHVNQVDRHKATRNLSLKSIISSEE